MYVRQFSVLNFFLSSIQHSQTGMSMPTGNFSAPLQSRDQNGMYYSDMVMPSMPPSSAPLPLQQQPMS